MNFQNLKERIPIHDTNLFVKLIPLKHKILELLLVASKISLTPFDFFLKTNCNFCLFDRIFKKYD